MGAERMPDGGGAAEPGYDAWGTSRRSRLFGGPFLVHADLHNHSWFSHGPADRPGEFVALRGFEWSHGLHGHMNVWGSRDWTEPLRTFGPAMGTFWRWLE